MKANHILKGVFIIVIGLCSCKKSIHFPNQINVSQVSMHTIAQDNLYGNSSEGFSEENHVINDTVAWNNLKAQMNAENDVTYKFSEQQIDFSKWTVLVSFDEIKPSGGHSIHYSNIVETVNNVAVNIEHISAGEVLTTVITQPYIVVKIAKTSKPIIFN